MVKILDGTMDNDPLTPLTTLSQECKNSLKNMQVAVVGAGLGGLMAGLRLSQHGVKVTVYEAHPQVGGRVRSNARFAEGRIIEEGAELIGSFHTVWLQLARKYGIAMINRMGDLEYEREGLNLKLRLDNTKDMTWREIAQLNKDVDEVLKSIADEAAKITQETCPWKESPFRLPFLSLYDKMTVKEALIRKHKVSPYNPKQQRLWKMLELRLVNDEVDQLDKMNYLGLLLKVKGGQSERFEIGEDSDSIGMRYWNELEIFRCADGNQRLANEMKCEIEKKGGTLMLETAVTQIDIHPQNVQLRTRKVAWPGGKLGSTGGPTEFKYVVLAIPPTVWGDVTIRDNNSPVDLMKEIAEIDDMGDGPAVKFFSRFKSRFWITEEIPSAPSGGTLKLGQIWEGTDNQMQTKGQDVLLNVFAGPILPDPTTKKGHRPPKESEMKRELVKLYPSYSNELIKPSYYKDWPAEPFIMTGYWTPKANGEIFRVGPKLNSAFHKRLYFAGEHTHVSYFGYMEGALRSGIRAANLLMGESCGMSVDPCPPEVRVA
ncbi:flavin monoamine oxidase family protein [Nitrosospira multiformis]|uniref:Tryptophan 2-monooxygenase n=1 Tax=Nitrosospira multiformis TaxID=1231 RepID=A0A1I7I382_9PROT|nr:NAD(P)/FAD-dependent oxidoreductase [Nitrosospira multiformis]SFU67357.1 Monoamine oxidase [Nitrosospira multiformis]